MTPSLSDILSNPSAFNGKTVTVSGETYIKGRNPRLLVDGSGGINISGDIPASETDFYKITGTYDTATNTIDVAEYTREVVKYSSVDEGKKLDSSLVPVSLPGLIATPPKEVADTLSGYLNIPNFPGDVAVYPYIVFTVDGLYLALSDSALDFAPRAAFLYQGKYYNLALSAAEVKGTLVKTAPDKINPGTAWKSGEISGIIIVSSATLPDAIPTSVNNINTNPPNYAFKRVSVNSDYFETPVTVNYSDIKAPPMGEGVLADSFNDLFKNDDRLILKTIDPTGKTWQMRRGKAVGTVIYPTDEILKFLDYSAPATLSEIKDKTKPALLIESFVDTAATSVVIADINPVHVKPMEYWGKVVEFDGYALGVSYPVKNLPDAISKTELPVNIVLTATGIADTVDAATSQLAVIGLSRDLTEDKGQSIKGRFHFKVAATYAPDELARGVPYAETAFFLLSKNPAPPESKTYSLYVFSDPPGAGVVNPTGGKFQSGSGVTLSASPTPGYAFDYWSGDASGTSPTTFVIMNADKGVTAHFRPR